MAITSSAGTCSTRLPATTLRTNTTGTRNAARVRPRISGDIGARRYVRTMEAVYGVRPYILPHPAFPWVVGGTLSRPTVLGAEVVGIGLRGSRGATDLWGTRRRLKCLAESLTASP